jgi:hypothetical protein
MIFIRTFFLIIIAVWINHSTLSGQSDIDSVLLLRNKTFTDYRLLEEASKLYQGMKPTNLMAKTKELVDIDNTLINDYLIKEIGKNKSLNEKLDKLLLEIALLKKETELNEKVIHDNRSLINILLAVAGSLCLLAIVAAIFFIDRQIRYRNLKIETEKTWPLIEEINRDHKLQDEFIRQMKQVEDLTLIKDSLTAEIAELKHKTEELEKNLSKEIASKKQIEEDIKKLIIQIKSQ